jgi:pyrimidodiazepine synthase
LPEWYASHVNPDRTTPSLQLPSGQVISDSLIASEYLDEVYPDDPLRLLDPYAHAQEKLAIFCFSKVTPFFSKILASQGSVEENSAKLNEALTDFIDRYLEDREFLGGDRACFADFMVWPWLERVDFLQQFNSVKINESLAAKLQNYINRMKALPAVAKCALPTSIYAKFYEGYPGGNPNWDAHLKK